MMKNKLKIGLLLIASLFTLVGQAQEIKTKAELDSTVILIGDQVTLHLQIELPNDIQVTFPVPHDSLSESVEIVERMPVDSALIDNNRLRIWQDFIVTSFDTGHHEIPSFYFNISYNGLSDSVKSNPTLLHVFTLPKLDSLMSAMKGPIDIKGPYEAPVTFKEVAPWIMGTLLLGGLIFLILYALRRKRNNQPIFSLPQKPKEPAHIIALRELDRIKAEKIWQQGKIKLYYSEVADTLREYIDDRFGINAMEQTTEETIAALKYRKDLVDDTTFGNLKRILTNADLVKFAKFEPLPDDNNLALVDAYFFVNQTKIEVKKEVKESDDDREGDEVILK